MSASLKVRQRLEALTGRYAAMKPQDRRALKLLMGVLLLATLWQGAWRPVEAYRRDSIIAFQSATSDLSWMQLHAVKASGLSAGAAKPVADNRSLLAIAGDTASVYNIALTHAEPGANDTLRLSLDTASYARLLAWLDTLRRDHAVKVAQINLQRLPASPGYVSASLTLHQ